MLDSISHKISFTMKDVMNTYDANHRPLQLSSATLRLQDPPTNTYIQNQHY
jgi:hypothetical protein